MKKLILVLLVSLPFIFLYAYSFEGIGAALMRRPNGEVIIYKVYPGTPAEKSGLKGGDKILAINGKSVKNMSLREIVSKIRGKKGTTVNLEIEGKGVISVTRTKITFLENNNETQKSEKEDLFLNEKLTLYIKKEKIEKKSLILSVNLYNPTYQNIDDGKIYIKIPSNFKVVEIKPLNFVKYSIQDNIILLEMKKLAISKMNFSICKIRIIPLKYSKKIEIKFLFTQRFFTYLHKNGKDILGSPNTDNDGTMEFECDFEKIFPSFKTSAPQYIYCYLHTRKENKYKIIDLKFQKDYEPFDKVNIVIDFKNSHQFIDWDENNYIKSSLNVWDGGYHNTYRFNYFYRNEIIPKEHKIIYRMGSDITNYTNSNVPLFSIKIKDKNPTDFKINEEKSYIELNGSKIKIFQQK